MIIIKFLLGAVLLIAIGITGLNYGPIIEGRFAPVISEQATDISSTDETFRFSLEGRKNRSCRLEAYSVGWRIDHSVVPVALNDADGDPIALSSGLQRREWFTLGPYWVPIPDVVKTHDNAALKITYYYRCSFLWLTEQDLTIPLKGSQSPEFSRR